MELKFILTMLAASAGICIATTSFLVALTKMLKALRATLEELRRLGVELKNWRSPINRLITVVRRLRTTALLAVQRAYHRLLR